LDISYETKDGVTDSDIIGYKWYMSGENNGIYTLLGHDKKFCAEPSTETRYCYVTVMLKNGEIYSSDAVEIEGLNISDLTKNISLEKESQYAEISCDFYYSLNRMTNSEIVFNSSEVSGTVVKITDTGLILGTSTTNMQMTSGWYHVEAKLDYARNNMIVTVTMPDGGTIQRADFRYLKNTTSVNSFDVISDNDKVKNISCGGEELFETEKETQVMIVNAEENGVTIADLSELETGDIIELSVNCIDTSDRAVPYSVIAVYYGEDGRLKSVDSVLETATTEDKLFDKYVYEYTLENLDGVEEVDFLVWESLDSMMPLGTSYKLKDLSDDIDTEAFNLVTTFYGDAGTTRGFEWTAKTSHTDMVIQYAEKEAEWNESKTEKPAEYTLYEGQLYYKADIEGLESGEEYIYRIGDTADGIWSDFYTFTTEPEDMNEFSFIGFTDSQHEVWESGFEYYRQTVNAAVNDAPDAAFMMNIGDLVEYGPINNHWLEYFKATKGYTETIPHMVAMGNHEARGGEVTSGKNLSLHFNNPLNGKDSLGELTAKDVSNDYSKGIVNNISQTVYSFDYGNAHIAVLNSGSDWSYEDTTAILKEQAKWLERDMKASDKKWKIVAVHQSVYPAKTERYSTFEGLADVIDECEIDLVLHGHDHIVTRTYPMKNGNIVTKQNVNEIEKGIGTVYTILGSAGMKRYDTVINTPEYAAVLNATSNEYPSYSIFTVNDEKIEVVTKQINGLVVDSFTIFDNAK